MCRYDSPDQPLQVNASAQEPDGAADGTWVGFALSAGDLVGTVLELRVGAAARILEGAAVGPGLGPAGHSTFNQDVLSRTEA
jgi:hypothetical protein